MGGRPKVSVTGIKATPNKITHFISLLYTLPETNIAPKNGWLEYYFPIGKAYFQGLSLLVSGRVTYNLHFPTTGIREANFHPTEWRNFISRHTYISCQGSQALIAALKETTSGNSSGPWSLRFNHRFFRVCKMYAEIHPKNLPIQAEILCIWKIQV